MQARLALSFGAGELSLTPGTSKLVEGTAEYNVEALKPEIITDGGERARLNLRMY